MVPGPIDFVVEGTGVRIEVAAHDRLVEEDGLLLIDSDEPALTVDEIRELRLADQR